MKSKFVNYFMDIARRTAELSHARRLQVGAVIVKDDKIISIGKSSAYLTGVEVDYVRQGLNEGFEFRNPNERDRCGCGESFRI